MKRKLTALFAAFLLVPALLLGSCGPAGGGDSTTAPGGETSDTPPAPDGLISVIADGVCNYKLIRAEEASEYVKKQVVALRASLLEYAGTVPLSDDWEQNLDTSSAELAARFEILIGGTNRPESAAAAEGIGGNEYRIRVTGNKIVIVGGSDMALAEGCRVFLTTVTGSTETHTMKIPDGTDITGKYESPYLIALTDQRNSVVSVYDLSLGSLDTADAVWTHKYSAYNIAGTKFREYKGSEVVLAAFGTTNAEMVDYATGKTLWSTASTAANPHGVELIPCGVVAVAASTGAQVRFFDVSGDGTAFVSFDLADAHGVLWDPEKEVLWAIGTNILTAFTVGLSGGKITVTERTDLRTTIPTSSAHDLQPYYGDTDRLWITTGSAVYIYSKSENKFLTTYEGSGVINRKNIKGIGNFADGSVAYIYPDGAFKSWTSASVTFIVKEGDTFTPSTLKSSDGDFYKLRVWNKNYQ